MIDNAEAGDSTNTRWWILAFVSSSAHYEFTSTQWTDGVSRVLAPLSEAATQVVLIPGTPATRGTAR